MAAGKGKRSIIGLIIFLVPVTIYILWIYASNQTNGYPDNVDLFNSYFPSFLRGRFTLTVISLFLCIIAVILCARNLYISNAIIKLISWFVVIAGSLLGFLNLFSMM